LNGEGAFHLALRFRAFDEGQAGIDSNFRNPAVRQLTV
jgi:hypothetical protein